MLDPNRFRPPPTLTGPETAARAEVDYETARRFWRALGLPDVDDDAIEFEDRDVAALVAVKRIADAGLPIEELVGAGRAYGKALSVVADTEARLFARNIIEPMLERGVEGAAIESELEPLVDWLLGVTAELLDYTHRRHLVLAIEGITAGATLHPTEERAVAYVDLVGFSRMSDYLGGEELGDLVERFEEKAITTAADAGVHVVKMIGDAVMFTSTDPRRLIEVVLSLVADVEDDEALPGAHAGVDHGALLPMGGDYFGPPANVAARLTSFARPGTVVASQALVDVLGDGYRLSRIGTRSFKGVGRVLAYKVGRADG